MTSLIISAEAHGWSVVPHDEPQCFIIRIPLARDAAIVEMEALKRTVADIVSIPALNVTPIDLPADEANEAPPPIENTLTPPRPRTTISLSLASVARSGEKHPPFDAHCGLSIIRFDEHGAIADAIVESMLERTAIARRFIQAATTRGLASWCCLPSITTWHVEVDGYANEAAALATDVCREIGTTPSALGIYTHDWDADCPENGAVKVPDPPDETGGPSTG
jgi:hypothetical protein